MVGIIQSPAGKVLKKDLLLHALDFWRQGRGTKDANVTVVMNQIGQAFERYAGKLESEYGAQKKADTSSDPYAV